MSNHEQTPDANPNGNVGEQIPHSGRHGLERPHREFDKTPLGEAPLDVQPHEVDDTSALPEDLQAFNPDNPKDWAKRFEGRSATIPQDHPEFIPETKTTRERPGFWTRRKVGVAGGVAVVGALVGGGVLLAQGGDNNTEPRQEPSASAPANPGETGNTGETETGEPSAYDFGIPAAEYQSDPQALGNKFYERYNEFLATGATEEEAHADDRYRMGDIEYSRHISQDIDQAFTDDLFVQGWETDPELASYVESLLNVGHTTRHGRLVTYPVGTEEDVPYVRQFVVDEVSGSTNPLTTTVSWHGYDNRFENNVEEVLTGDDPNDDTGGATFTWTEENGELKIASIAY